MDRIFNYHVLLLSLAHIIKKFVMPRNVQKEIEIILK
jgi:hypothetical protein